jgi:hypothetical protein
MLEHANALPAQIYTFDGYIETLVVDTASMAQQRGGRASEVGGARQCPCTCSWHSCHGARGETRALLGCMRLRRCPFRRAPAAGTYPWPIMARRALCMLPLCQTERFKGHSMTKPDLLALLLLQEVMKVDKLAKGLALNSVILMVPLATSEHFVYRHPSLNLLDFVRRLAPFCAGEPGAGGSHALNVVHNRRLRS